MVALHMIARALGVEDRGAAECAVCGASPFGPGEPLGANFADHAQHERLGIVLGHLCLDRAPWLEPRAQALVDLAGMVGPRVELGHDRADGLHWTGG